MLREWGYIIQIYRFGPVFVNSKSKNWILDKQDTLLKQCIILIFTRIIFLHLIIPWTLREFSWIWLEMERMQLTKLFHCVYDCVAEHLCLTVIPYFHIFWVYNRVCSAFVRFQCIIQQYIIYMQSETKYHPCFCTSRTSYY